MKKQTLTCAIGMIFLLATMTTAEQISKKMLHLELEMVPTTKLVDYHLTLQQNDDSQEADSDIQPDSDDESESEEKFDGKTPSQVLRTEKSGYRYQAPIFFGANKDRAMMAFDTSSSFTTVTSDICSNCKTKAYRQQKSS